MAFMRGSPVLTDEKFEQQRLEAGPGASVMTVGGTVTATAVLFVCLLATAIYGWTTVTPGELIVNPRTGATSYAVNFPAWLIAPLLIALVLGFITAFKPKAARITAPLYCLCYGLVLGAISALYNNYQNGIVTQALFATLGIFCAMLFLYVTRIIKVTNKFVAIVVAATMGIFLMYLLAFVVSMFGGEVTFLNQPSLLSIGLSVGIIIVAALNLAIDFAFIEKGSEHGAPKYMEWYAAWGLTVTLIWIYLEVLRLISLLNRR